jgi:sporulation protein YlmC with PRC-barrel domain
MRKSYRAATATVVLLMTAAALHAAGQGNSSLLSQKTQDDAPQGSQKPNEAPGEVKPTVTVFDRLEVQGILGKEVRSEANENMGRIVDVVVDRRTGQVRAAIIDFGGFLGVGNRKIAVAWNVLRFPPDEKDPKRVGHIVLDLSREQVQAAPEYKEDKPVVVLGASGGLESLPFP